MYTSYYFYAALAALTTLSGPINAATIRGGSGIGYSGAPAPWMSTVFFERKDLRADAPELVVKTGDEVTPTAQSATQAKIFVPPIKATAWCDSYANPLIRNNEDFNTCYGSAWWANWYVLDFNALQKSGVKGVWVSATAKRYNDGDATTTDDTLVPALTVFKGKQNDGTHLFWFPQIFQSTPAFWADQLSPFTGGATQSQGWATAYTTASQDMAQVTGWVKLKPDGRNYLTVVVGGDARQRTVTEKARHEVNYALALSVSRQKPAPANHEMPPPGPQHFNAGPGPASGSGVHAKTQFAAGVTIRVNNQLSEDIQIGEEDNTWVYSTLPSGSSKNYIGDAQDGDPNYLILRIKTSKYTSSEKDGYIAVYNPSIGYPFAEMAIKNYAADKETWQAGYFDNGEKAATTVDDWTYTIKRGSDGIGIEDVDTDRKNFEVTIIESWKPQPQ